MDAEPKIESANGEKVEDKKVEDTKVEDVKAEKDDDEDSQKDNSKHEQDIIRQIEYYFSENNLRRDKFMSQKIAENDNGWIDISVLLTFNRLKSITEDATEIVDAMDKSPHGIVQISEDRKQLRRHPENPLPEFNETRRKEVQGRTAYAKGFPLDSSLSTLIDFFNNNFENVEQVIMRKYFCPKSKQHLFKGSVFITFSKRELAEEFVNKPELKYKEKVLLRYMQTKYHEVKKAERSESDKKKKNQKQAKELAADKEAFALPKAAVVHFTLNDDKIELTREDIKAKIAELDESLEIAFIHFQKGDKVGDVRFGKENNGKTLMEKLDDGKLTVKEVSITFALIEGDEEEKFLEKAILDMKQRRNFQKGKGGKGKQNFGRKRRNDGNSEHFSKKARSGGD